MGLSTPKIAIPKPEALLVVHVDASAVRMQNPNKIDTVMSSTRERIDFYRRYGRPVIISRFRAGISEDDTILRGIPVGDIIDGISVAVGGQTVEKQVREIQSRIRHYQISALEVIGGWEQACLRDTIKRLLHPDKHSSKPAVDDILLHQGKRLTIVENKKLVF